MTEMIEPVPAAIDQEQLACEFVERARAEAWNSLARRAAYRTDQDGADDRLGGGDDRAPGMRQL